MEKELKEKLFMLAEKYETADFINKDPSRFMHEVSDENEMELRAFIAANLAFGRRDQILLHVQSIMDNVSCTANSSLYNWIIQEKYKNYFTQNEKSFYRMYSHNSMNLFFTEIKRMLEEISNEGKKSLGDYFEKRYNEEKIKIQKEKENYKFNISFSGGPLLQDIISNEFPKECNLIPHSSDGAAKKVNMFLRWMVRTDSPVDLGLWNWYPKCDLLMPLDTHVMQQSVQFGLLNSTASGKVPAASLKTAFLLTDQMREVFGNDPVRGDFALFGLGVNS